MKADIVYHNLLQKILHEGVIKEDRTGTGTISIFGEKIEFDLREGFPLLTTKKVFAKGIIAELLWFINGDTNIKYLVDQGVNIWSDWPYAAYLKKANTEEPNTDILVDDVDKNCLRPYNMAEFTEAIKDDYIIDPHSPFRTTFAKEFGELGPVYGKQWRDFQGVDQFKNLIDRLQSHPDCRRLIVNSWDSSQIKDMALPPCHLMYQCNTQVMTIDERRAEWCKLLGKSIHYGINQEHEDLDAMEFPSRYINMIWYQRSIDSILGLPFNIASYAILLQMLGLEVNMIPKKLIGMLADTHIYSNHIEQTKLQLSRDPNKHPSPTMKINKKDIFNYTLEDFTLEGYESYPGIKALIAV